jgi:hypothetical protein
VGVEIAVASISDTKLRLERKSEVNCAYKRCERDLSLFIHTSSLIDSWWKDFFDRRLDVQDDSQEFPSKTAMNSPCVMQLSLLRSYN